MSNKICGVNFTYTRAMKTGIKVTLAAMGVLLFVGAGFMTVLLLAFPLRYQDEIRTAGKQFDIDPVVIASVIRAESNFRRDAVSNKGAVGLMQIMPATAEFVASKIDVEDVAHNLATPHVNITIGTFYLRYLMDKFGDLRTVLAAYNAGEGRVADWLDDNRFARDANGRRVIVTTPYPETNAYIEKVLNARNFYRIRF